MNVRIAGLVPESFVDGAGVRYAIFFQGCRRNCAGCHNPQTHDLNGGTLMDTNKIIGQFARSKLASGITLTGGEPLLQIHVALELARAARLLKMNVWLFTGYTFEQIKNSPLLKYVDVLVDGEYREDERDLTLLFRGSRNQRVIDLNKTRAENRIVLW